MLIDAHHHLWQLDRPECLWPTESEATIFRDYDLSDYRADAVPQDIGATILVQSQENREDTEWLLQLVESQPLIEGVVGWVELSTPDAQRQIAELASLPKLVGLRPMVQDRRADWYDDPALAHGLNAMVDYRLALDALIRVRHLPSLDRLAIRHPGLPIVVDHAAKPAIGDPQGFRQWYEAIAPLAGRPNVSCKLSGLLTECPPDRRQPEVLEPYVAALLELFGPERLMWGSDWPVLNLAGDFGGWLAMARMLVAQAAHQAVFEDTARRFYDRTARGV